MFTRLRENPWLRKRLDRWLDKRIPPATDVTLGHKSIFIMPTKAGWMYLAMLVLLLITAINYQNSLVYALTFWLFGLGVAAMLFTYRNLAGLSLQVGHVNPVFAGSVATLPVRVSVSGQRLLQAIGIGYPDNSEIIIDAVPQEDRVFDVSFRAMQRGWLNPGRILIESRFPLGLFRAWSWVRLDFKSVVYPAPEMTEFIFASGEVGDQIPGVPSREVGQQDFQGLRRYQSGDSMKIIAWKQVAQGRGMVSKELDHDEGALCWLDWSNLHGTDIETRLSRLTAWVLEAHQRHWRYGLRIPGAECLPDSSDGHRDNCLKKLALYDIPLEREL